MRSPGRPGAYQREAKVAFWEGIAAGLSSEDAALACGVPQPLGTRRFRDAGGIPPLRLAPHFGRYLSFAEREEIAVLRAQQSGIRAIARRLGRSPSTISRELFRNAETRWGYAAISRYGGTMEGGAGGRQGARRPFDSPRARRSGTRAGIPPGAENRTGGSARDHPAVSRPLPLGDAAGAHLRGVPADLLAVRGRGADHRLHHRGGGRSGHPGAHRRTGHPAPYRPGGGLPEWYEDATEHAIVAEAGSAGDPYAQPAPECEHDQRVSW